MTTRSLRRAIAALPWSYETVRNKLSLARRGLCAPLPFIEQRGRGRPARVHIEPAAQWLEANSWPGLATTMRALADAPDTEFANEP